MATRVRARMKIKATMVGGISKLRKDLKIYDIKLRRAGKQSAKAGVEHLKKELRQQAESARLGNKIANAWRGAVYPKTGDSLNAAGAVWSNVPHIISAFDKGKIIRVKDRPKHYWLAIPTENAPKRGGVGSERLSLTPANFPAHRYGKLRFVPKGENFAYLVVDNLRASYAKGSKVMRGYKKANNKAIRTQQGIISIVMFHLIRQVNPGKRLDVAGAADRAHAFFVNEFNRLARA